VILSRVVVRAVLVSDSETSKTIKTWDWFDEAQNLKYLELHLFLAVWPCLAHVHSQLGRCEATLYTRWVWIVTNKRGERCERVSLPH
jgi:hypothetical protein